MESNVPSPVKEAAVIGASSTVGSPNSLASAIAATPVTVRKNRGRPRKYGTPVTVPRRNRGRPRKYETPDQALAAKKTDSSSNGNEGHGLTSHVVNVADGEDIAQKIMSFMHVSDREICVISASGSISSAFLSQTGPSVGIIAYKGHHDILSLSGSYVKTEFGARTGGLSITLSTTNGQIVGGKVSGPLQAAGPVQVIIGSFVIETNKKTNAVVKLDFSPRQLQSHAGGSSAGIKSTAVDTSQ